MRQVRIGGPQTYTATDLFPVLVFCISADVLIARFSGPFAAAPTAGATSAWVVTIDSGPNSGTKTTSSVLYTNTGLVTIQLTTSPFVPIDEGIQGITLSYTNGAPNTDLIDTTGRRVPSFSDREVVPRLDIQPILSISYISGTGTAGADNTAQTVKTLVLPANTITQVGDRLKIQVFWSGDTGAAITGTLKVGPSGSEVTVAATTDSGTTALQVSSVLLHYIDNTHANVIEEEGGTLGANSAANVAGFDWDSDQNIIVTQDAIPNNHIVVYEIIVEVLPKVVA